MALIRKQGGGAIYQTEGDDSLSLVTAGMIARSYIDTRNAKQGGDVWEYPADHPIWQRTVITQGTA